MNMRFDVKKTVEENFNTYQDELEKRPEMCAILKVSYDHFLKSYILHKKTEEAKDTETTNKQTDKEQQFKFI